MTVLAWALVAAALCPQDPQDPQVPPPDARQVARAEALLAAHGERGKKVDVLVAAYTQRRHTRLSKKPLVSSGAFLFVKEPACVVFRCAEPRRSVVRLTTAVYEVFRPARKRLERFHLDGPELAAGLFAAVGGDVARLRKDFSVAGCEPLGGEGLDDAAQLRVRLLPKQAAAKARLRELTITFDARSSELRAVSYRDHAGDLVEIELRDVRNNPKDAPSAELDVPADTRVLEHRAEPPK